LGAAEVFRDLALVETVFPAKFFEPWYRKFFRHDFSSR